ncbi:MAG: GNAT family N-acetyltransferase [Candidatus Sericytochromatia bacterium]|nr:GNAT family N-acetyltransferase [Candidatus Sericytochromatia bacterium]
MRRPTPGELPAVLALMDDPASVHRRVACLHRAFPEQATELRARLVEDENLVLEAASGLVGYASWQRFGDHAHLNVMTVAGAHQRRGHGTVLYDAFRREAATLGARSLSLRAYADSGWALAFYERQGLRMVTTVAELTAEDAGLLRFLDAAASAGAWPDDRKVLFYGKL